MIKSITVINHLGSKLVLELARPEKSGFVVKKIEGLGPSQADINTTEMATNDGSIFTSARKNQRNIVLYLDFSLFTSAEVGRQLTYKYFPVKKQVELKIETDTRKTRITGYVESNSPDIFSKQEGTQISILCPDPNFYSDDNAKNSVIFNGVEPVFEFPFENNSLVSDLIEFSYIKKKIEEYVYYNGDSGTGMTIIMKSEGEVHNITLYNVKTRETIKINSDRLIALTGSDIVFGDVITICTVKGKKSVTLLRNGDSINILNCFENGSTWFQIEKGENIFAYTAESGSSNLRFSIEYDIIYEGV